MSNELDIPTTPAPQVRAMVDINLLRQRAWEPECAPSIRTIKRWQKLRLIPFVKIGHMTFFDLDEVCASIKTRHTIKPRV